MLLTISTTYQPATDLGYLLHKNPARLQTEELSFGKGFVFYPEASDDQCTAALLIEIDPVALVRGRGPAGEGGQLEQYVNDRPYVASSFLSVAIAQVFGTAMQGRCKDRSELAQTAIPLEATLSAVPSRGGEVFIRKLFEPLGYAVTAQGHVLDEKFPDWGASPYFTVTAPAAAITLTASAPNVIWGTNITLVTTFGAGGANRNFSLQASRDLVSWTTITPAAGLTAAVYSAVLPALP